MSRSTRFGIEEEFVLLDAHALTPVFAGELYERALVAPHGSGTLKLEFAASQIEASTTPVRSLQQAREQLEAMRRALAQNAPDGTVVAATGAPFILFASARISPGQHYEDVAALLGRLASEHVVNGLHVHVEATDDEARVQALLRVRERLALLLALSANSPFSAGAPAGLASWRSAVIRRLPVSSAPPAFHDADEYHRTVDRLVEMGALPARSSVSWGVRLSDQYDTVETRVCDTQLSTDDTLLLAALTRAIAVADDPVAHPTMPEMLDGALWLAGRHGMDARLPSPDGGAESAWTTVERMLDEIGPVLDELGDAAFVRDRLDRLRTDGTGSQRQMRAYQSGGTRELSRLLVQS